MDLKKRLKTAFMIMIIIPIFMILLTGKLIVTYQLNSIQEMYDVESDTVQIIANPMQILNRVTRSIFNQINLTAKKNPEKLEDESYIKELNEELSKKYSYLLIRRGQQIVFNGNIEESSRVITMLPEFGEYDTTLDGGIYLSGKTPVLLKNQDFYYSDGEQGTIFIVTDVTTLVPQIRNSAIQVIVSFLVIIIITAIILIFWLYRSMICPLNILKDATRELKNGNLDYSITGNPEDEIGQLCLDFEEMRIQLKNLIEMQMQYEQDSRELISNISHDLKTPLTAIKGYAEGLLDKVADTPQRQEKYLKTIYNKANDMSALVDELSFFSKIDCNNIPYNFTPIPVTDYFQDCMEELRLDLEVKNIELVYENEVDRCVKVLADPEQMKRVINNIVGNAVKYLGKDSGKITMSIKEYKKRIQISISDNGMGIAEKDLPFIFDRFYRADASRNSKKGGTGLGLAIVRKIVEEHSGQVWAESIEGEGTTIYISLPKYLEEAKPSKSLTEQPKKLNSIDLDEKKEDKKEKKHIRRIKGWKKTES